MNALYLLKYFNLPRNSQQRLVRALSSFRPANGRDLYKVLELEKGCSDKDVRDAYIRLSKEHHPDRNPDLKSEISEKRFIEINEAYSVLSKPATRRRYDQYRHTWEPSGEFASSYDELKHRYKVHNEFIRKRSQPRTQHNTNPLPLDRLVLAVVLIMFVVGMIEFNVVKRVVQGPDEIIEGMPIYYNVMPGMNISGLPEQERERYYAERRRIIGETVRSMKADNEARKREQDRLRNIIEQNKERLTDSEE